MLESVLAKQVQARVEGLAVHVTLWNGQEAGDPAAAKVKIKVHEASIVKSLINPSLGKLARAYVEGGIDVHGHPRDILAFGDSLCEGAACRDKKGSDAWKWWRHTRLRDRKNIQYHYDVSNEFYGLWLDARRVYSCAYFRDPAMTLEAAQEAKLDHICRKLALKPSERFLDIGCGWGGLVLWPAEHYGVNVVGITLSQNQHDHVKEQIAKHVFDWVCPCGNRIYQGPTPQLCLTCKDKGTHVREMIWKPRRSRVTLTWRFDQELHFQYWGEYQHRQVANDAGDFPETMSCLGACWFMERDRFWELGGMDEQHGSWGQMGTEVGCKSWLSGGRMVTNRRTWFAHMFRTQGGDFGFPYAISGREQDAARAYSQDLWINGRWPLQIRPLSWLVEYFSPVTGWYDVPSHPSVLNDTIFIWNI